MKDKTMKKPNGAFTVARNKDEDSKKWSYVADGASSDTGTCTDWIASNGSAGSWEVWTRRVAGDTGTDTGALSAWKPATTGGGVYVKA